MKACLTACLALTALAGSARATSHLWQYHLPETGLLPSAVSASYVSHMGARHGAGALGWSQLNLTVPFADPRRTNVGSWYVNVALDAERTELDNHDALSIGHHSMWDLSLPVTLIHSMEHERRLVIGVVPHLATDFGDGGHSFEPGAFVDYRFLKSETLSVSAGLALAPLQTDWWVLPFFCVEKEFGSAWSFTWKGYDARMMYNLGHGMRVGAFVRGAGGSWATDTADGSRLLRVRSLVAGLRFQGENADAEGHTTSMLFVDVGSALMTRATLSRWNDRNNSVESRHFHPGFYLSGGLDFRF